jgi:hypothetical protein
MLAIALLNENQHQQKLLDCSVLRVGRLGDQDLPKGDFECQFLAVNDPLVAEKQFTMRWERSSAGDIELTNHGRSLALSSGPRILNHLRTNRRIGTGFENCRHAGNDRRHDHDSAGRNRQLNARSISNVKMPELCPSEK